MADDPPRKPPRWRPPAEIPPEGIARAIGVGRDAPPRSRPPVPPPPDPPRQPDPPRHPPAGRPWSRPAPSLRTPAGPPPPPLSPGTPPPPPGAPPPGAPLPPDAPSQPEAPPARRFGPRRTALIVAAVVVAVALTAAVLSVIYAAGRLGQVGRVSVSGLVAAGPGSPQTILLTGSDTRAGESAADASHFGSAAQVSGQRSDTIILIHLVPGAGKAAMLSIPRDLFVPIAGSSKPNRINTAFDTDPSVLVRTISQDFGITINHYAQEDFSSLQNLTDAAGGVCMNFPYPARDGSPTGTGNESGLNVPIAGKRTLDGAAALSLVRSRYYQYEVNGVWKAEGTGDIGRIERQHIYMRALATKLLHASLHNPFTANRVLGRAVKDIKIDKTFTSFGLLRMALHLRSLRPAGMPSWTMPYTAVSNYQGFGDVLLPQQAQDAAVIAAWKAYGTTSSGAPAAPPSTVAPGSVTVQVLNGSGIPGQAGAAAAKLKAAGFSVPSSAGTAPAKVGTATVVAYGPGQKAGAAAVAALVGGPVTVRADNHVTGVVLTTGSGFTGIGAPAAASAGSGSAAPTDTTPPPWDPRPC